VSAGYTIIARYWFSALSVGFPPRFSCLFSAFLICGTSVDVTLRFPLFYLLFHFTFFPYKFIDCLILILKMFAFLGFMEALFLVKHVFGKNLGTLKT